MKPLALLAAAACLALPLTAQAQRTIDLHVRNAGQLAAMCSANPREAGADAAINYCHGFTQAVVDEEQLHGKPFCFPEPSPRRDATLHLFVEWVRAAPDRRDANAAKAFVRFLVEHYPCK